MYSLIGCPALPRSLMASMETVPRKRSSSSMTTRLLTSRFLIRSIDSSVLAFSCTVYTLLFMNASAFLGAAMASSSVCRPKKLLIKGSAGF